MKHSLLAALLLASCGHARVAETRPAPAPEPKLDFAKHVKALAKRLPEGFHVVVQPPFVVIGDSSPSKVKYWAKNTVQWAVDLLKKDFFAKDPDHVIDVWLFKDPKSYRKFTWKLFRDRPSTPYGYYSPTHRALIMDISTGGGTLVHEIVHPFVAANFPECPSWFNEGLGSLYEQCREVGGKIMGLTNWRLAGLQKAIRKKRVPSFEKLLGTTRREFYEEDRGTNYAQARYLCYYLQEKKLLRKYYKAFFANRKKDPTGYATLQKTLVETDMAAFQKRWEAWVLTLRFR